LRSSDPVENQYAHYPYPEPGDDIPTWLRSFNYDPYDPALYSALFWPEGRPATGLNILSAGCGSMQAAVLAFKNPKSRVTGIDFSPASIAHEERLRQLHQLENLTLKSIDLIEAATLDQTFDLIVCSGVLHHLPDPAAGLKALASVLDPSYGAMILMLYGRLGRFGIYPLQDAFRRMGIRQTRDGVARVRAIIKRLSPHHPGRKYYEMSGEMASDAAVVDTFLHARDIAFSVPEVLNFVESNGLRFQSWLDNGIYNRSWDGTGEGVSERDRWAIAENLAGDIPTHHFIASRPERSKRSLVSFAGEGWLSYFPVRHPALRPSRLQEGLYVRGQHGQGYQEFSVSAAERSLVQQADGAHAISSILKRAPFVKMDKGRRFVIARDFYERMWRSGHMFFSETPVRNVRTSLPESF
jgi:SAM-dependent methyltransferase